MAKKQVKISEKLNPFAIDKNVSPAGNFFPPQVAAQESVGEKDVQNVHNVQNKHNVHYVEDKVAEAEKNGKTETASKIAQDSKKHIHLVLTQDKYAMLERMASLQHLTVTKCISEMIEDQYTNKWQAISDQLEQMKHKLAKQSPKTDILGM